MFMKKCQVKTLAIVQPYPSGLQCLLVPGPLGAADTQDGICLKVSTLSSRGSLKLIVSPPSLLRASVFVHMMHTLALTSRPQVVQWAWSLSSTYAACQAHET